MLISVLPNLLAAYLKHGSPATGDIIDGWSPKDQALSTLDLLVREFDKLGKPHYHIIGNHCLYNLPRQARFAMAHAKEGLRVSAKCPCQLTLLLCICQLTHAAYGTFDSP